MTVPIGIGTVVVAFFVGAIPFGVLVSRAFYGTDIRSAGSGNIGAANALRTLGRRGAIAVLALDALKGFAPTLAAFALGGPITAALAAFAAIVGHCWSPFIGFRGGKGVATYFGALFALWWPAGLAFAAIWAVVVLTTGFSSVGSMLGAVAMGAILWLGLGWTGVVYGVVSALLIIARHRENLDRLRHGTENRLSLLKAKRT
ncbi:MAG: glycerol-3-phosphate 1-O-acyltransferase PlsY [Vulcanimicrobiaceae bacterium]